MRYRKLCLFIILLLPLMSMAAVVKNKSIDGINFSAKIWMKGANEKYEVSVIFDKKAANIFFTGQELPPLVIRTDRLLTLYLFNETINNPKNIMLKQVEAPMITDESQTDPETWKVTAIWFMDIDIADQ